MNGAFILINIAEDYEEDEKESNKSEKIIEQMKPTMKEIYKNKVKRRDSFYVPSFDFWL